MLRATTNRPFGVLGGYIELAERASRPDRLDVPAFLLLGILLGGGLYAAVTGTFFVTMLYPSTGILPDSPGIQLLVLLIAGMAMGFGGRTAGGCTSGHGLTGAALGSPASIASAATFFAVAVVLTHVLVALN
jgi:uncharacterized membrane protein YedE/YeeE